jgi:hypothetical protein
MKRTFRYAIVDRKIYLSASARNAGEIAFGRPSGLNLARPADRGEAERASPPRAKKS